MKCLKNNAKKIIIIALLLSVLLTSCGGNTVDSDTSAGTSEQTAAVLTANNDSETEEKTAAFDFEAAVISSYKILNVGDRLPLSDIFTDGEVVSSHPSVADTDNGEFTAKSAGVTLAGNSADGTATVICVLPEGIMPEMTAGEPTLLEVGKTAFIEGFGSSENYKSSSPDVASIEGTTVTAKAPGYAVIDASNASMPKLFSYIVFDRNAE